MIDFKKVFLFAGLCVCLALLPGTARETVAHPFHASFAEVEWNSGTGMLEVALQMDLIDLEKAVRLHCGKRINLDHEDSQAAIQAYVRENFSIAPPQSKTLKMPTESGAKQPTAKKRFKWVGSEMNTRSAWLYFEIAAKEGPEGMVVSNGLLAGEDHPTNTVLVRAGKRSTTMTFNRQATRKVIKLAEPTKTEKSNEPKDAGSAKGTPSSVARTSE